MKARPPGAVNGLLDVAEHDYAAAGSCLGLIHDDKQVAAMVSRLRAAAVTQFAAKDIFRASRLSLLGVSDSHVDKERRKLHNGTGLSPVLLMRDEPNGSVVIADGYHRRCAV
ncbi:MAG: hypothetical protein M3Y55_18810 [Pseudomonadota bacterium]|nr:hypothetical protein [Pseudomonadota bacterium]